MWRASWATRLVAFSSATSRTCSQERLAAGGLRLSAVRGGVAALFRAVRQRLPRCAIAGPDTAGDNQWLVRFADEQRHDVAFLTQHYYAEGPPTDPSMTIERLLGPSPRLEAQFNAVAAARRRTGLPFRMVETNSCYQGGKPGVSDTFASALWAADLMYRLAQAGAIGVNFHGGGYGWYAPVAGTRGNGFVARPIYYGMLLFAVAGAGRLVMTEMEGATEGSVTAYCLKTRDGELKLVVLNKSLAVDTTLTVGVPGVKRGVGAAAHRTATGRYYRRHIWWLRGGERRGLDADRGRDVSQLVVAQ